ncbi:MAG: hypothetical protein K9N06_12710 [Candidatus Cloacimonetes bacterium]|nr:hypothetical protein [Candidatus Cloacimonadota bacterium]
MSENVYNGDITLTSTDADNKTVSCSGSVTDGTAPVPIHTLDFETAGGYTTDPVEFVLNTTDYFTRTNGGNIAATFTSIQGSYYFAGQDIDAGTALPAELLIDDIDISGNSSLGLSVYLAEDDASDSNEDWDALDYVHFSYDIDNSGSFTELLWIEGQTAATNVAPAIDTDFDGNGDGTLITDAFTEFTASITGSGSLLDIKILFSLDSGDEDIALDNIVISGSTIGNNPPMISEISHNPSEVITSSDAVSVSADVTDSDGTITGVELHWGTSSGSLGTTINMSNTSGDTYTTDTDIPAQSDGITVYYEIEATDDEPDVATSSEQSYTVDDPATTSLPYSEDFATGFGDIYTYDVAGDDYWLAGSGYAEINGYPNGDAADEDWLILPGIDFSSYSNVNMTFDLWWQYGNQDATNYLKLYYSTDYLGLGDPTSDTWTEIPFVPGSETVMTETSIPLSTITAESVYLAFKYITVDNARSWQIDNIAIAEAASSVVDPTLFSAVPFNSTQIDLSWTENASSNDVLIAWNATDTFGTPVDGNTYNSGVAIPDGGTSLGTDADGVFNHTSLDQNTQYFYKIWSVDGSTNYSVGVTANATTFKAEPSNHPNDFAATANGTDQIDLSWSDNDGAIAADGFLILGNLTGTFTTPVDGVAQSNDTDLSDGSGVRNILSGVGSTSFSGLVDGTHYYFVIYPYTNSDSHIDYKTDSAPADDTITEDISDMQDLIISEVTDPGDHFEGRFVEIFNPGDTSVDLTTGNWYLSRQTNGGSWEDKQLTGSIPSNGAYLCANYNEDETDFFYVYYGFMADYDYGGTSGNGDDGYFLYYNGDHTSGTLVDAYGVIDEDGTGLPWDYVDSQALRINTVSSPNTVWTASEWEIVAANIADVTPGYHEQGGAVHHSETMGGGDSVTFPSSGNDEITITIDNNEAGQVEVTVSTYSQNYPGAGNTYNGWWNINVSGNTEPIDLVFTYEESDLNGIQEAALAIFHYDGSSWVNLGGVIDTDLNTITLTDYAGSFSPFTLGDNYDAPLPITLSTFTTSYASPYGRLLWTTLSEMNNAGWNIYRAENEDFAASALINTELIPGQGTTMQVTNYSYVDEYPLTQGDKYYYWLESISYSGAADNYGPVVLSVPLNGEEETPDIPEQFGLLQNYPNPFNPNTTIKYNLPIAGYIELNIYNIKGNKITTLVSGIKEPGYYQVNWDGKDDNGSEVSSGIYIYKLTTPYYVESRSMLLIK